MQRLQLLKSLTMFNSVLATFNCIPSMYVVKQLLDKLGPPFKHLAGSENFAAESWYGRMRCFQYIYIVNLS
jgi:hypothetical protein